MSLFIQPEQPKTDCFLPDFCNISMTLAVVMAAELLAVILSVAHFVSIQQFWSDLSMQSLYIQWIALGSIASLCLMKNSLRKLSAGWSGFFALIIILIVTIIVAHLSFNFVVSAGNQVEYGIFLAQSLIISFIIGLLSLHYFYVQNLLVQQQKAEAEARFQALQARIRPHFLFNSMNTIAHLTRADPAMAESVVEDLADIFRATLAEPGKLSTLGQEIELSKGYLNIESMRLGDRLRMTWQLDETADQVQMPSLMLQPLLENAIYHGIETSADGGDVQMTVARENDLVSIQIENTVNELKSQMNRKGNRMAQQNTRQRLMSFFGEEASFEVKDSGNKYQINLSFPVNQNSKGS